MTALPLTWHLFFFFGITGIGGQIIQWMPETLKSRHYPGRWLSCVTTRIYRRYRQVYVSSGIYKLCHRRLPITFILNPFNRFKQHSKLLSNLAKFGLLRLSLWPRLSVQS